jgi:hypothetical protein
MSGVMIKAGIFGIIRFGLELLGPGPAWWGLVVLAVGAASAILGVLYALAEHDLKRLLAFHSVENIGIILIGLGVAFVGAAEGVAPLLVVGLAAALFHTLNHAMFKGLLFLGAGAFRRRRDARLNRLGGLARSMPLTAAFRAGAAAISGPPLSRFAQWYALGLLALGGAGRSRRHPLRGLPGGRGAGDGGLAVACFVKATGMTLPCPDQAPRRARGGRRCGRHGRLALGCIGVSVAAGRWRSACRRGTWPLAACRIHLGVRRRSIRSVLLAIVLAGVGVARAGAGVWASVRPVGSDVDVRDRPSPPSVHPTSFSSHCDCSSSPCCGPAQLHVELHDGTPFPRRITYRGNSTPVESRLYGPLPGEHRPWSRPPPAAGDAALPRSRSVRS